MSPQTVIITGASRGIGAATARIAAAMGANVVLCARAESALHALAREITGAGGQALAAPADVSRQDECQRLVDRAVERFGGVDAIVNNAATAGPIAPVASCDPDAWLGSIAVNVLGPLMLAQAALPHLRARKGRVINVSSGAASIPVSALSAYCASKAALNICGQILAKEEPDVTVITFEPGTVDTDMHTFVRVEGEAAMLPADHALFKGFHESGALTQPEVPGRVLAHLALRAPRSFSGALIAWNEERAQRLIDA
jgi:NAD(P)-dependent dehydrogenase (short-subunit alcohol dehydrogenase family)